MVGCHDPEKHDERRQIVTQSIEAWFLAGNPAHDLFQPVRGTQRMNAGKNDKSYGEFHVIWQAGLLGFDSGGEGSITFLFTQSQRDI